MNSKQLRSGAIYLLLLLALGAFLYTMYERRVNAQAETIPLGEVAELVRAGEVEKLVVKNDKIFVTQENGEEAQSRKETHIGIVETLGNLGVTSEQIDNLDLEVATPTLWENWSSILLALLPLALLGAFFIFILRQAQGSGNQAFSFGKSKARMFTGDTPTVTFDDVAGNEEGKQELQEVVEFLKEPEKFAALGARIPSGVLLVGPPGTGKTLMAKAVSGEAGVPFFNISGSEFVEMFVGVGASRVRDLFEQAKKSSPSIIFIDEIDAVGRHRGAGMGGSHDEREQTLNQILVEMDGFDTDTNIIIIAATNRPDILDPALLRPGRFDRRVMMDAPDVKGRRAILDVHVRGKPLAADVDLDVVAKQTPGFAGADIENLVNEAAILAARRNKRSISLSEFQEAIDRVRMGPERRSRLITPKEKIIVAYHEAGHAVAAYHQEDYDKVHKITIIARGQSLGHAQLLPQEDARLNTKEKFQSQLVTALGGRVAEEIKFNDITNGAASDLEHVTNIARAMVTRLGMSEKLGPIQYGHQDEMMFLGRAISEQRNYSDKVAQEIDEEVSSLVDGAYRCCHHTLDTHWDELEAVAQALLEHETINATQFEAIMQGEDPFSGLGVEAALPPVTPTPASPEKRPSEQPRNGSERDMGGTLRRRRHNDKVGEGQVDIAPLKLMSSRITQLMQDIQPNTNGKSKAPQANSGAFPVAPTLATPIAEVRRRRQRPTVFPPDAPSDSLRALLYNANRHEFAGAPLSRWLIILLFLVALIWATGLLPGYWWISGSALLLAIGLITTIVTLRRGDFVHFAVEARPELEATKINPNEKIAVNITGLFSVEGQEARYTGLPGFYRTFATREHALLCLVRDRRFLKVGRWPALPTGMWYIFVTPEIVRDIRYGQLHFSRQPKPAIAIDYEIIVPKSSRFRRDQVINETVYIACQTEEDATRILADLMVDEM